MVDSAGSAGPGGGGGEGDPLPFHHDAHVWAFVDALLAETARVEHNKVATTAQAVVRDVIHRTHQTTLVARGKAMSAAAADRGERTRAYHQAVEEWAGHERVHARRSSAIGTAWLRARGQQGRTRAARRIR